MFCSSCGKALPAQGRFCIHCGLPTAAIQSAAVPVTVVAASPRRTAAEQGDYITGVAGRVAQVIAAHLQSCHRLPCGTSTGWSSSFAGVSRERRTDQAAANTDP